MLKYLIEQVKPILIEFWYYNLHKSVNKKNSLTKFVSKTNQKSNIDGFPMFNVKIFLKKKIGLSKTDFLLTLLNYKKNYLSRVVSLLINWM